MANNNKKYQHHQKKFLFVSLTIVILLVLLIVVQKGVFYKNNVNAKAAPSMIGKMKIVCKHKASKQTMVFNALVVAQDLNQNGLPDTFGVDGRRLGMANFVIKVGDFDPRLVISNTVSSRRGIAKTIGEVLDYQLRRLDNKINKLFSKLDVADPNRPSTKGLKDNLDVLLEKERSLFRNVRALPRLLGEKEPPISCISLALEERQRAH